MLSCNVIFRLYQCVAVPGSRRSEQLGTNGSERAGIVGLFSGRVKTRRHVTIYSRNGCHLCEDAHATLVKFGFLPEVVDIDEHPSLLALYTDCVPVVVIDGKVRFRGRINEVMLRRLL